jgi:hypothetical protein
VLDVEAVVVIEPALNAVKKATCLASVHLLVTRLEQAEDLAHVSSVGKMAILAENALLLKINLRVEPALSVVRKDICQENVLRLVKVEVLAEEAVVVLEPVSNAAKKVT